MGYRGELMVVQRNLNGTIKAAYEVGDRCAQILIRRREHINWVEAASLEELGETERGEGGFGSTNK